MQIGDVKPFRYVHADGRRQFTGPLEGAAGRSGTRPIPGCAAWATSVTRRGRSTVARNAVGGYRMGDFRKFPWRFRPMCGARAVGKEVDG